MPVGLLLLGFVFDNTPIELRYLAFATPFIGLLLATLPRGVCGVVLAIQAASIAGLMTRPETMQPARATAVAAVALVGDGVVLVPRGNDGVGIVGAFAIEAPPRLRLLVLVAICRRRRSARASVPIRAWCSRCLARTPTAVRRCQRCARRSPDRAGERRAKWAACSRSLGYVGSKRTRTH